MCNLYSNTMPVDAMRNLFDVGFFWSDELLRLLVLWIAVAGAVAASRTDRHISIAVLDRFLPERLKTLSRILIDLFTAAVCALITWHSIAFVRTSREFGDTMLGDVPAWVMQLVLPIGFGLIAYRHTLMGIKRLAGMAGRRQA